MRNSKGGIYKRFVKRPMDFVLALLAILVLSPVLLVVTVLVRKKLGSPVIFKQERPGLNEEIFTMYKFRTMTDERDENGDLLPDSVRLTGFGRLLRSTSLDELPGLVNILNGDMSVVGPRPLLIKYLDYYTDLERIRHSVKPGLTGLAQINGRNNLDWNSRLAIDIKYVKEINFLLDLKIIIQSITKVFKREGVVVVDKASLKDLNIERGKFLDN